MGTPFKVKYLVYGNFYKETSINKKSLSYSEKLLIGLLHKPSPIKRTQHNILIAVWTRLELATPCVTGRYSNQLNYQTVLTILLLIISEGKYTPPIVYCKLFLKKIKKFISFTIQTFDALLDTLLKWC